MSIFYQVDSEDANFLFLEQTDSPTHISLISLYDQGQAAPDATRFERILQLIDKRIATTPVFRQKIKRLPADLDYPYWVDDQRFDLDYHVRQLALPRPGDWRQFCIQVSRLHSRPLDTSRPLWELYVIEGLDTVEGLPNGAFALYLKIHHAAMDEFTALELLESLHQTSANPRQHEEAVQPIAYLSAEEPGSARLVTQAAINNTLRTIGLVRQSLANFRTVSKLLAHYGLRAMGSVVDGDVGGDVPRSRFGGRLGSARVFEGIFIERKPFDQLAALVPGATLTHVLMLVCGEALHRYLQKHDDPGAKDPLFGLRQVNLRNAGAHALVGNRIAIEQVELFSTVPNFTERLHAIVGSLGHRDEDEDSEQRGLKLRALYEYMPAPLLSLLGRYSNRRGSLARQVMSDGNLGFAELRGPTRPLYLLSAKLYAFASITPLYSGCGLMFSACTYCERIALSFTSDRRMMADPVLMRECLLEAVAELRSQVNADRRVEISSRRASKGAAA